VFLTREKINRSIAFGNKFGVAFDLKGVALMGDPFTTRQKLKNPRSAWRQVFFKRSGDAGRRRGDAERQQ